MSGLAAGRPGVGTDSAGAQGGWIKLGALAKGNSKSGSAEKGARKMFCYLLHWQRGARKLSWGAGKRELSWMENRALNKAI